MMNKNEIKETVPVRFEDEAQIATQTNAQRSDKWYLKEEGERGEGGRGREGGEEER